jgi:hypothetical protein
MTTALPFVWSELPSSVFCSLRRLQGVDEHTEINKGISRASHFPTDAYFEMDTRYKKQTTLSDSLWNAESMPVISPQLKAAIEALQPKHIEFLPVQIRDHKGNPVKEQYHIMSPLKVVDCIDREQSKLEWNVIDTELISDIFKLVLRPEALDPNLAFFRVKHMSKWVLVRADVASILKEQGFTGFEFRAIEKFTV